MTIPLKEVPLEQGNLAARMTLTEPGQITWVDLARKEKCRACRHFRDAGKKKGKQEGYGSCYLVVVHTKKRGVLFPPYARACTKFEPLE